MPKNIVICCDGTGMKFSDRNSNVVHLTQALIQDPKRQACYYHPGVGTEGSPTASNHFTELWSVVLGLGFGAGLLNYVGDAYRYLMDVYEDGDQVFLFGFSRGAYTVRALSGMVHMFGLLQAGNSGLIPYVLKMFARHTRKADGMKEVFTEASGFKATFSRSITLHMVGVWDTVDSVGMIWDPLKLPYTAVNPTVRNGRHAVSIDEHRAFFRNNLWGREIHGQSIKQVWFAGDHCDVGGGNPSAEAGLSQIALRWMLCEAMCLGLLVDLTKAKDVVGSIPPAPPVAPDPARRIHNSLSLAWWPLEFLPRRTYDPNTKTQRWIIPLGRPRQIPLGSVMHESVVEKLRLDPTYRPTNLPVGWEGCVEKSQDCEL